MYMLKNNQPDFEVMDGQFAGRKYVHGVEYAEVPPDEVRRFTRIEENKTQASPPAKKKAQEKGGGEL